METLNSLFTQNSTSALDLRKLMKPEGSPLTSSEIAAHLRVALQKWSVERFEDAAKVLRSLASKTDCTPNNPAWVEGSQKCLPPVDRYYAWIEFMMPHLKAGQADVLPEKNFTPAAPVEDVKILEPEQKTHAGRAVVKIDASKNVVTASYEKDDVFRNTVKELTFAWDPDRKVWVTRAIGTDTLEDIAAEVGAALLGKGFVVEVSQSVATKILAGDWQPSTKRYVALLKDGNLAIRWFGYNDTLYQASRKIRGSKWNSPYVTVPVANYLDVIDFAQKHGFTILASPQKAMDAERARTAEAIKVDVASLRKPTATATAKDEVTVIDDLKD